MQRIETNDPLLTDLWVGDRSHPDHQSTEEECVFSLSSMQGDEDEDAHRLLTRLGESIGRNTHMEGFFYDGGDNSDNELPANTNNTSRTMPLPAEFFDGLKSNESFSSLTLKSCDTSRGTGRQIVDAFSDNENITCLTISDCESLLRKNDDVLASTLLSRLRGVNFISFSGSYIGDEQIEGVVSAIMRGVCGLKHLELTSTGIGNVGCRALAPLLRDADCNLEVLFMGDNDIDDAGAIILADALADNSTVQELNLESSPGITDSGWDAFSRVLCNTSSIDDTCYSNHTLEIVDGGVDTPDDILSLCELNGSSLDKGQVAIKKILLNHAHFIMEPFFECDLKMLPLVVNWFDRASSFTEEVEVNVDARKLSSVFQFVRVLPMMFVPSLVGSGSK